MPGKYDSWKTNFPVRIHELYFTELSLERLNELTAIFIHDEEVIVWRITGRYSKRSNRT
jgi:hypothetical protein